MTTSPDTQTSAPRRPQGWRLALFASGVALLAGGPMHPDSDASGSMREELAAMTADDMWVPGHTLLVAGTVLLVAGLWMARRQQVWPAARRPLAVAVVALSLYTVETVFHLAAVVDSDALHDGHTAPVAFTHLGLAAVLYPVSGLAIVYLATTLARIQSGLRRVVAVIGIVGGLAHAVVVPLTFLSPDTEFTPLFAVAGVLTALWALGTAATGARAEQTAATGELASVG